MPKCAECGFLALRELHSHRLLEAPRAYRKTLAVLSRDGKGPATDRLPVCFRDVCEFAVECPGGSDGEIREAITKDRPCGPYEPWNQGFTPKEHAVMIFGQSLLDSLRRWAEADSERRRTCDLEDKAWREKCERDADERHRNQLEAGRKQHNDQLTANKNNLDVSKQQHSRIITILGFGLIIATILAPLLPRLLAYFFPNVFY